MSEPFHRILGRPEHPLFLFGDHASKHIPDGFDNLGLSGDDLTRHIAWDIGTEGVIRGLAKRFDCSALIAGFSRLLIDANRDPEMKTLIPETSDGTSIHGNVNLDADARQHRIEAYYRPYHAALGQALDRLTPKLSLSVHSFTPKPDLGAQRHLDLGLLVKHDVVSADMFTRHFRTLAPELSVAVNEPYSAYDLNYTVDVHLAPRGFAHLAIEIRQDHISDQTGIDNWVKLIGDALEPMIGD